MFINTIVEPSEEVNLRLSGLKVGACLRPERSTELTPKSQAEGSGLPLSAPLSLL